MTPEQTLAYLNSCSGVESASIGSGPLAPVLADVGPKPAKAAKPKMVTPEFIAPSTWLIPVMTYGPNGGKIDRSAIGRAGSQRKTVAAAISPHLGALVPHIERFHKGETVAIAFTRLGRPLDDDNLRYAMKAIRDMMALYFGAEDNESQFCWQYKNRIYPRNGIIVEVA
jgi:hypothetical protein